MNKYIKKILLITALLAGTIQPIHAGFTWTGFGLAAGTYATGFCLAYTVARGKKEKDQTKTNNFITSILECASKNKGKILGGFGLLAAGAACEYGIRGKSSYTAPVVNFVTKHAVGYSTGIITFPCMLYGYTVAVSKAVSLKEYILPSQKK